MEKWTPHGCGPDRQRTFYRGDGSPIPVGYEPLREAAEAAMSETARAFVGGGAGSGSTVAANREAFERWRIVPRVLRGVADRDLSVTAFGRELSVPVMLAPIGAQSVIHEDGELATAQTAADLDVPMALSTARRHRSGWRRSRTPWVARRKCFSSTPVVTSSSPQACWTGPNRPTSTRSW